jgi:hypothetical protein
VTTFILLLVIIYPGYGVAAVSAEYASEEACRAAGDTAARTFEGRIRYVCTPGGVPKL